MRVLIEGRPGAGKTTVAIRVADLLRERGIQVQGFVTAELRDAGARVGFSVRSFGGEQATLAHVDLRGPPRVGKYGVDLDAFERVALPALDSPPADGVVVVDELGRMELASERFRERVRELFERPVAVVATVHAFRYQLTDEFKARRGVELIRLGRATRDALPAQIVEHLVRAQWTGTHARGQ